MAHCIREDILQGVEKVPVIGVPGTLVVYGENASPILSNANQEVILAAAQYGEGRIVVFSHDGYVAEMEKRSNDDTNMRNLYRNIQQWVTKGKFSSNTQVVYNVNGALPPKGLVIWSQLEDPKGAKYEELLKFVASGGAMIIAMTPWGFLQLKPEHTLETLPMNRFVKNAGMCFTSEYFSSGESLSVRDNCAQQSHVIPILENMDIGHLTETITRALSYIPVEHNGIVKDKIQDIISHWQNETSCHPCPLTPAKTSQEKALITLMNHEFESGFAASEWKIPTVGVFPGDLPANQDLEIGVVTIKKPECEDRCFHPTGYYVPAGKELRVTLGEEPSQVKGIWSVAIGSHSDSLLGIDDAWRRWPVVQIVQRLDKPDVYLKTHSGGLVYFVSNGCNVGITAAIENVVQAPYYDINDESLKANWQIRRKTPGLWADLVGRHIMLTVPASSVRELDSPEEVISFWDSVVETHCHLAGVDPCKRRREWVVTDEQPSAGYMHSGYPIVTCLDVANPNHNGPCDVSLLNVSGLRSKGSWGMFHELGHNLQDSMWTFEGTGEVTCNIFTLHAMDVLCGQKPWIHAWLQGQIPEAESYLKNGATFAEWQNQPGVALFIYAQLARDFGWLAYREVFMMYNNLQDTERPEGFQDQVDQWISRFSRVVEHNLCPLFEFWGFPISTSIKNSLSHLPVHFPKDEIMRHGPGVAPTTQ